VGLSAEFSTDTAYGNAPLTVNFNGSSINYPSPDSWQWDFGDNSGTEGQMVFHSYVAPGLYTVDLAVNIGSETYHRQKKNHIFVQADTLLGAQIDAMVGSSIVVPVYIRNTVPLKRIIIPFHYSGDAELQLDSISTVGCQTEDFSIKSVDPNNQTEKELVYTLAEGTLEPGDNLVANIYMTVLSASETKVTNLTYDAVETSSAQFTWNILDYYPDLTIGRVRIFICGDANGDSKTNLLDVSFIINSLYRGGPKPDPIRSADVNHDGKMNLLDISYIINFMYRHGPAPNCP
jgi:hypothetical protein